MSRISKLFADRDQTSVETALERRKSHNVTLVCGTDVGGSYTLQLAVLTAARIAVRCFPGAVRIALPEALCQAQLRVWPSLGVTFGACLYEIVGADGLSQTTQPVLPGSSILFGNAAEIDDALRVTFDGWAVRVGPHDNTPRLREREYCALAGIFGAALAISEAFLSFAEINVMAGRRRIEISLWRPDLAIDEPGAIGVPVLFLPKDAWLLGLGHLGNAYLWSLASLPYRDAKNVCFHLNDFDIVEDTNAETGVLFRSSDSLTLKTRVLDRWLARYGFSTRLVERRFDQHFRVQDDESKLALCGFDSNLARRNLETAGFKRIVESGLGGLASNFEAISLHSLPSERRAADLWPDPDPREIKRHAERVAAENTAYAQLADDECGRILLAGKSVAVPFVGVAAAALVVAETLRILHRGPAFGQINFRLSSPNGLMCSHLGDYKADAIAGLNYVSAQD